MTGRTNGRGPMSVLVLAVVATIIATPTMHSVAQAADSHGPSVLPRKANINLPYPGQIDLEQEPSGWTYRLNQNELPLYMSTADPPGKSLCNGSCAQHWVPVIAEASAKPLGDWSIIVRQDGQRQWAFQNHPVYTHTNDSSEHATGVSGSFHLMPHFH